MLACGVDNESMPKDKHEARIFKRGYIAKEDVKPKEMHAEKFLLKLLAKPKEAQTSSRKGSEV